ncbi:MAG: sugar ABC transporter ATP-binding protein [Actinobacteria bacterium]|nr:sugar ABC transporter ATP-binding protein [Actinomycetota bacterium]
MINDLAAPLLQLDGVSKRYGPTVALDSVDFDLRPGEVHALMGENGAGKSTLMKILAGTEDRDSGSIRIDGERVDIRGPRDAKALGIAIINQELNTVPAMTVAENLCLGEEPRTRAGVLDRRTMIADARAKLQRISAPISPTTPLGNLSVGMQQMVEIARAVSTDARILVLDEPTAALSRSEALHLYGVIADMKASGVGLVYISHRMEEVWQLADRVTVFRDGRNVGTRSREEVTPSEIVRMMVGRPLEDLYRHDDRVVRQTVLDVQALVGENVGPVDLHVDAGEVVGVAGLVGSGRTELARVIFGVDHRVSGTVILDGQPLETRSPKDVIAHGVGMVPESRKEQALFPSHSVANNISLSSLKRFCTFGVLRRSAIRREVRRQMDRLQLRPDAINLPVSALSGGNQQKAALARWLMSDSQLLILDEPTRGVDIGAKSEIYSIINQLSAAGKAILVISSDLPEVLGISDRILVMRHGRVVGELTASQASEELVMSMATGTYEPAQGDSRD